MRPQALHADQDRERRRSHGQRHERSVGQVLRDAEQVAEEALLVDVDAEQFRHLVEHDHQADASLEPGQHRVEPAVQVAKRVGQLVGAQLDSFGVAFFLHRIGSKQGFEQLGVGQRAGLALPGQPFGRLHLEFELVGGGVA